jgi:peptidoglycan/LPS O-acetylase OafA/YrhL
MGNALAASAQSSSGHYRPEIDGLRALAVIPVILFHLKLGVLSGGFLGVDVFFVISGYLITSIILREHQAGKFSFKTFWLRRARRILPMLVTVVIASLLTASMLTAKGEHPALGFQAVSALLSFANITLWQVTKDYWGPQADDSPFLHTWSLSVEEQFYLLFPAALILALKWKPRWLIPLASLGIVGSFAVFVYGIKHNTGATFFLLPTRAWEMGAGTLLAILVHRKITTSMASHASGKWLGGAGLLMIAWSYLFVSDMAWTQVIPVMGAVLVIGFAQTGPVYRVLSSRPPVFIGLISYSLYLWHWPVIVFCRHAVPYPAVVSVCLTFALSVLSYYLIERPARSSAFALKPLTAGYAVAMSGAILLASSSGLYDVSDFARATWKGQLYDVRPRLEYTNGFRQVMGTMDTPAREPGLETAYTQGGIIKRRATESPEIVVLGDSHACMWGSVLDELSSEVNATTSFYAMNAVQPFVQFPIREEPMLMMLTPQEKHVYDTKRVEFIEKWKPRLVIFVARWNHYTIEEVRETFAFLQKHVPQVLLIDQPPELTIGNISLVQHLASKGVHPAEGALLRQQLPLDYAKCDAGRKLLQDIASEFSNVRIAGVYDLYRGDTPTNACILEGKELLFYDSNHLTEYGAAKAKPVLRAALESLLKKGPVETAGGG